jgi:dolichol-phosphate mannosyltransferase
VTVHAYDIEGIVRLQSVVPLRELAYFKVDTVEEPDLIVRGGFPSVAPHLHAATRRTATGIAHREQLGAFGADFDVAFGRPIVVRANPLLRWSPHVLYTNVVEPFLRFIFASKGYALLHCASVVQDGEVLLLSAQTDTGKTTTVLRLIARHNVAFLADDMTIIEPGGIARRYPKPMTMSFHTFQAFDWHLSPLARAKLSIQSRVHSKSGRRIGHGIARMPVPIMAINAVTQGVVPPPKYHVSDLMNVTIAERAPIRRVVFMERGEPMEAAVEVPAAVELLLRNTEDAYTFPPYRSMAPFISIDGIDHEELLSRERDVLLDALRGADIRLLRVEDRSWADRIPAMASAPAPVP